MLSGSAIWQGFKTTVKWALVVAVTILILLMVTVFRKQSKLPDMTELTSDLTLDQTILLNVGDVQYRVPVLYLYHKIMQRGTTVRQFKPEADVGYFRMEFLLPEYRPSALAEKTPVGIGNRLTITVSSRENYSFERMIQSMKGIQKKEVSNIHFPGVQAYRYEYYYQGELRQESKDIYLYQDKFMMECSADGVDYNAVGISTVCKVYTSHAGNAVSYYFSKDYIQQFMSIHSTVMKMLTDFNSQ